MITRRGFRTLLAYVLASMAISTMAVAQETEAVSETTTQMEEVDVAQPTVRIIPQLGASSFGYKGAGTEGDTNMSGGITFEVGNKSRVVETGVLYLPTASQGTGDLEGETIEANYFALPLMAKFYMSGTSEKGLYLKGGMLTAFLASEDTQNRVLPFDLIGSAGLGAKFNAPGNSKLIIEGTYNHGMIDVLRTEGDTRNRGLTVTGGVVFGL